MTKPDPATPLVSNVIKGSSIIITNITHVFNRRFSGLFVTRGLAEQYPASQVVILSSVLELENSPQYDNCHYLRFTNSFEAPKDPWVAACFSLCYLAALYSEMRASYLVRINWSHGKDRSLLKPWLTLLSIANLLPFHWVAYFPIAFITAFASENTRVCISRDARRAPVGTPVACELLSLQLHFKQMFYALFSAVVAVCCCPE